jgi:hypothetical protein
LSHGRTISFLTRPPLPLDLIVDLLLLIVHV